MSRQALRSTRWTATGAVLLIVGLISLFVFAGTLMLTLSELDQELDHVTAPVWWSPVLGTVGSGLVVAAFACFFVGAIHERRRAPVAAKVDLRPLIAERELPFTVCAKCRIIIDLPYAFACPQCDRMDCCVRVESDEERGFASAAVGPPPAA